MSKIIRYLPELQDDEQLYVASIFKGMSEKQAEEFTRVYRQRRKDSNITLVTALVGLLGVAGVHRFYVGQVGLGLLYFLTAGLCVVGTVVDAFRYRQITYRYNARQADDVAALIHGAFPEPQKALESGDAASDEGSPAGE